MNREQQLELANRNFQVYRDNLHRELEDEFIADWTPMPTPVKLFWLIVLVGFIVAIIIKS